MKFILKMLLPVIVSALAFSTYSRADEGADIFKTKGCAACHGPTGAGDTTIGKNLKLPDLGSEEVQKQTDDELANIIASGKGKMPKYGQKLSKQQIGEVVKFIRTLKN